MVNLCGHDKAQARLHPFCSHRLSHDTAPIYIDSETLNKNKKKVTKNNQRVISKPHAYFETMKVSKELAGGVAHTRDPLGIHFGSNNARKMSSNK